jgi:MMPL family
MDYEVFLRARRREEYDASGSTGTAVVQGLGRVGQLVTSAALILFLAFASLASVPAVDVKIPSIMQVTVSKLGRVNRVHCERQPGRAGPGRAVQSRRRPPALAAAG